MIKKRFMEILLLIWPRTFKEAGAEWIHMVDLDGAKDGKRVNDSFVIQAAKELKVNVQIGGGIRTEQDIVHYLENDVATSHYWQYCHFQSRLCHRNG